MSTNKGLKSILKPPSRDSNNISITVGDDIFERNYLIKKTTPMSILKRKYSHQRGIPVTSLRFLFDGVRLNDCDTPEDLQMEDGDFIEVYEEQIGGY